LSAFFTRRHGGGTRGDAEERGKTKNEREIMSNIDGKKKKGRYVLQHIRRVTDKQCLKNGAQDGCDLFAIMCSTKCTRAKCQQKYGAQQQNSGTPQQSLLQKHTRKKQDVKQRKRENETLAAKR
jgi:hypothetical protein